jgi:predicted RNA polymerase sigma factor
MVRRIGHLATSAVVNTRHKISFKQQYEKAERRRAAVLQRLAELNDSARAHPAYRRAMTLINQTFRKASVAQRLATLQAAEWLIEILENLTGMV